MKKTIMLIIASALIFSCKKEQAITDVDAQNEQTITTEEEGDATTIRHNLELNKDEKTSLTQEADGGFTFRYNLKKGETYPFALKINMSQSLSDGVRTEKSTSTKTTEMAYLVDDVITNGYKLTATFKGFSESFTGPNGESLTYNTKSTQPADKDVAQSWKIYKAISGESFKMEIDNKGKVLNVSGLDNVITKVQAKLKSDFNEEEQKILGEVLRSSLSKEFIKMQFEETLNFFPDKSMKVGEDWSDSQNISEGPIKGTNKVTRTFKGIDGNLATIAVNGTQTVSGKESQGDFSMEMSSNATIKGNIILDVNSGWINNVDLIKNETNTQTFESQGQKESITQKSTTKTTVN